MPHVIPPLGLVLRVGPVVPGERPDPARPGHLKGLPGPGPPGQEHRQDEPQGEFADGRRRVRPAHHLAKMTAGAEARPTQLIPISAHWTIFVGGDLCVPP